MKLHTLFWDLEKSWTYLYTCAISHSTDYMILDWFRKGSILEMVTTFDSNDGGHVPCRTYIKITWVGLLNCFNEYSSYIYIYIYRKAVCMCVRVELYYLDPFPCIIPLSFFHSPLHPSDTHCHSFLPSSSPPPWGCSARKVRSLAWFLQRPVQMMRRKLV